MCSRYLNAFPMGGGETLAFGRSLSSESESRAWHFPITTGTRFLSSKFNSSFIMHRSRGDWPVGMRLSNFWEPLFGHMMTLISLFFVRINTMYTNGSLNGACMPLIRQEHYAHGAQRNG